MNGEVEPCEVAYIKFPFQNLLDKPNETAKIISGQPGSELITENQPNADNKPLVLIIQSTFHISLNSSQHCQSIQHRKTPDTQYSAA